MYNQERSETNIKRINFGRNFIKEIGSRGYSVKLEGQENFRFLKDNPIFPVILVFNHAFLDDPVVVGAAALDNLGNERNFMVPVSYYYSQFTDLPYPKLLKKLGGDMVKINQIKFAQKFPRKKNKTPDKEILATLQQLKKSSLIVLYSLLAKLGVNAAQINMPRLVQAYTLRDESLSKDEVIATAEKSAELFKEFDTQSKNLFLNGGVLILSPEGHRSADGQLQPAEDGVGLVIKRLLRMYEKEQIFPGIVLPIGIISNSFVRGINFNPVSKRQATLKIGQPKTLGEIELSAKQLSQQNQSLKPRTALTAAVMLQLREILPERMWGVYHPSILPDTLAGRFELRVSPEDKESHVFDIWNNEFLSNAC